MGEALEEVEVEIEAEAAPKLTLVARLSALLFVATRPMTTRVLARAASARVAQTADALEQLQEMYCDEINGFSLQEVGGAWQLRSAPAASETIKKLVPQKGRRLSRAAAETLAVIAYKQPVQRAEIEAIRGVDALPTLKTLLDGKLVRVVGREDAPGQPALYGTTEKFLQKFGLRDLSELPSVRELEELNDEPGEVIEDSLDDEHDELIA